MKDSFYYENGFYLTSNTSRFSKFATHYELFKMTSSIRGEIVECGVFKGVSLSRWIKFRDMLENAFSRKIIAFDIFGKFPEATYEKDIIDRDNFVQHAGDESISVEELNSIFSSLSLNNNLTLVAGDVINTVPEYIKKTPSLKISLLHIDVDLYEPTKVVLETFYEHVVKGGVIVLDDYGAFAGANKAVDEFFGVNAEVKKLPFSNAIGYIVKT